MRIAISHRGRSSDFDVSGLPPEATVADLIDVVWPTATRVVLDGRTASFEDSVFDTVRDGSDLEIDAQAPPRSDTVIVNLHSVLGPNAGCVWQLGPGRYSVGETPGAALRIEGVEGTIDVLRTGEVLWNDESFPAGTLRVGTHRLRIARRPNDSTPHPPGPRSFFNRPPRHLETITRRPIPVPRRERITGKPRRISAIMLILPVLTGVGLAVFLGRMMFLAFALMGPVMMIGNAIDDRRRRKKETREAEAQFVLHLESFEQDLGRRASQVAIDAYHANPSVSELLHSASLRSQRIWERRQTHPDHLRAVVGYGAAEWAPDLAGAVDAEPEVGDVVARLGVLPDGPVLTSFDPTRVLGIAGPRASGQALAADVLCQLAVTHGPVDVRVAVVTDEARAWDWAKWLPHTLSNQLSDIRLLATTEAEISALLTSLRNASESEGGPVVVLAVDHPTLDDDQTRIIRECLAGVGKLSAGIVLVDKAERLPSACTEVVELANRRFRRPYAGLVVEDFDAVGIAPHIACQLARSLASLDDPEATVAGAGLPELARLLDLLDMRKPSAELIEARWMAGGRAPKIKTPVGASETGVYSIDLVKDGPHGLMAGTTGSGKSEFLRTLVAGLAANVSPDYLTFVLVDYKGGAAFDACADLPHVVGLVTDLDEHLGQRALTSLEAELHHREARLRDAGATDIDDYWALAGQAPLPRLAVVVDEFATLAKELPDFMDALVDIAQRGRSLGVHMLLATQRPSGVIKDSIRANTNLRISLRVQTQADSNDVLNSNEAAALPRTKPGRGYARLGPGELVPFQTALSTVTGGNAGPSIRVTPFVFGMAQPTPPARSTGDRGPTDLDRLVAAIKEASHARGTAAPRRPWTEPLRTDLSLDQLPQALEPGTGCIGLVDQPHRQRQTAWSWAPHDDGNLLLIGTPGWGPTDGLLAAATSLASTNDPDQVHIYAIDHGPGRLAGLEVLPHVGSVIPADDIDRQKRLLRHLRGLIDSRRQTPGGATTILLLDGLAGFKSEFEDPELMPFRDMLQEIAANGPQQGVFLAATGDQNRAVPSALAGVLGTRLVFSLADRLEYGMLGVKGGPPELPRRRAIDPVTQEHVQIALVDQQMLDDVGASASLAARTPEPILSLATEVPITHIVDAGSISDDLWELPIGIADATLTAATVRLHPGDHLMIAGPNRSGRTTTLVAIASIARKLAPEMKILAVCPRSSDLRLHPAVDTVVKRVDDLGQLEPAGAQTLVLVDDAEEVDGGVLSEIVEKRIEGITVIAAGRTDALRGAHRHWTRAVRAGRRGLILEPFDSGDGDVLGIRLPRTARPFQTPDRGYLVDGGSVSLVQVAKV